MGENKALLPWREFHVSPRQIAAITAGIVLLIGAAFLLDRGEPLKYAASAIVIALLVPAGLLLWGKTAPHPVALDRDGIAAPTLLGTEYLDWKSLHTVAHVHSIIPESAIAYSLVLFPRTGRPWRIALPRLSGDERHQLFEVLRSISKLHHINFVLDHTPEGQRALKRLPWLRL